MTEKLKMSITYGKTFNLGNYESERYSITKEFYQDNDLNICFEMDRLFRQIEEMHLDRKEKT